MQNVKNLTKINYATVGSVAAGIALFGLIMYAVRKAPNNAVTTPVKKAAEIAAGG